MRGGFIFISIAITTIIIDSIININRHLQYNNIIIMIIMTTSRKGLSCVSISFYFYLWQYIMYMVMVEKEKEGNRISSISK